MYYANEAKINVLEYTEDGKLMHVWALDWPGNFCLRCGLDDPNEREDALVGCPDCSHGCNECNGTGCVPNPNMVVPECKAPHAITQVGNK